MADGRLVMISHRMDASEDGRAAMACAKALAETIRNAGIEVFCASDHFRAGVQNDITEDCRRVMASATDIVLLMTKHFAQKTSSESSTYFELSATDERESKDPRPPRVYVVRMCDRLLHEPDRGLFLAVQYTGFEFTKKCYIDGRAWAQDPVAVPRDLVSDLTVARRQQQAPASMAPAAAAAPAGHRPLAAVRGVEELLLQAAKEVDLVTMESSANPCSLYFTDFVFKSYMKDAWDARKPGPLRAVSFATYGGLNALTPQLAREVNEHFPSIRASDALVFLLRLPNLAILVTKDRVAVRGSKVPTRTVPLTDVQGVEPFEPKKDPARIAKYNVSGQEQLLVELPMQNYYASGRYALAPFVNLIPAFARLLRANAQASDSPSP